MRELVNWLEAVRQRIGLNDRVNVVIKGNKLIINGYEFEFKSALDKVIAEALFGSRRGRRRVVEDDKSED